MSKTRIIFVGLMAALMTALYLVQVHAGEPNPGPHGIIRILLPL